MLINILFFISTGHKRIDEGFLVTLYMAADAGNPHFRLGYNSLTSFATINHLQFQVHIYLNLILLLSSNFEIVLFLITIHSMLPFNVKVG